MEKGWLANRAHGLEEAYFWGRERALIARLRDEDRREQERRRLKKQLGVADETVLRKLQAVGITPDTVALLPLVPLVEVAWAAGNVTAQERRVVCAMAARQGVAADTPVWAQLTEWLDRQPAPDLFDTAYATIRVMLEGQESEVRRRYEHDLVTSCTEVAEAAGEMLGLVPISHNEHNCLERIVRRLNEQPHAVSTRREQTLRSAP